MRDKGRHHQSLGRHPANTWTWFTSVITHKEPLLDRSDNNHRPGHLEAEQHECAVSFTECTLHSRILDRHGSVRGHKGTTRVSHRLTPLCVGIFQAWMTQAQHEHILAPSRDSVACTGVVPVRDCRVQRKDCKQRHFALSRE